MGIHKDALHVLKISMSIDALTCLIVRNVCYHKSSGSIINKHVIISAQEFGIHECFLANETYMEDLQIFSIAGISHYTVLKHIQHRVGKYHDIIIYCDIKVS